METGASTPGWTDRFPRRGKERKELFKKCGSTAFLLPNKANPGQSKFPIFARVASQTETCATNCRGVQSAYSRARQYKYYDVAEMAQRILQLDCPESKQARLVSKKK